jgi:hypothetical protein
VLVTLLVELVALLAEPELLVELEALLAVLLVAELVEP